MEKTFIAWDLGATKCAAGLISYNTETAALACRKSYSIKLAETTSLADLVNKIENNLGLAMADADAICIGGAGHYDGKTLLLEGIYPYAMTFKDFAQKHHWPAFAVVHDYAPVVCATFTSYMDNPANLQTLNDCIANPTGRRVALGIGTGLGLKDGVLLSNGDFWLGQNEIGHIGIATPPTAPHDYQQRHEELMRFLKAESIVAESQQLTFEKILSGQGIARLHQFFNSSSAILSPEEVGFKMQNGETPELSAAFAWYLGLFIGTVQLIFMPCGGIWMTGGVTLNHLNIFEHEDFITGIHASPAYLLQRQQYPLGIMRNSEHALMGGGFYAAKKLLTHN
jgi:glucokinase